MPGILSLSVNDVGVTAKLRALHQAAEDKRAVFERVGAAVLTKVQMGFKTTTDPWGHVWPAPKFRIGQALSDTGRLRRSIRSQADNDGVTIGTNLIYARIHQFGGTIKAKNAPYLAIPRPGGGVFLKKKVKIPKRSYLPLLGNGDVSLPPQWQKSIIDRLKAHFMRSVKEAA
jgi:phage virion morphogenesis protein